MAVPESALLLAGFLLAHSAWSISDAPELLVPLAMIERNGKREILRFEAATQAEAIARGKAKMASLGQDVDYWAFAREGSMNVKGNKIDVVSMDIGGKGIKGRIAIIQQFEPYARRKHFRLIGDPEVAIDGVVQAPDKVKDMLEIVRRGVAQHSKVAPLWDGWRRP